MLSGSRLLSVGLWRRFDVKLSGRLEGWNRHLLSPPISSLPVLRCPPSQNSKLPSLPVPTVRERGRVWAFAPKSFFRAPFRIWLSTVVYTLPSVRIG
ncbi:hypothetical protein BR93DRAFT_255843 [Coniochaeta sp. PMI_546]|nr:hypothetical protein BR93DRAFT_255843 [Coniochaeta sp. PMI_546]